MRSVYGSNVAIRRFLATIATMSVGMPKLYILDSLASNFNDNGTFAAATEAKEHDIVRAMARSHFLMAMPALLRYREAPTYYEFLGVTTNAHYSYHC